MPEIIAETYAFALPVFLYDSDFSYHENHRLYWWNMPPHDCHVRMWLHDLDPEKDWI